MEYTPPPAPAPPPVAAPRERPFGVTILAVLYMLQGLLMLAVPFIIGAIFSSFLEIPGTDGVDDAFLGVGLLCFAVFLIIALICFLIAWGLFKGAGWARVIAIILAIIGLINIPIGTIISIIILIYLFKPEVKAWFQ